MYRPDDWGEIKADSNVELQVTAQNSLQYIAGFNLGFEAGADAILEAQRRDSYLCRVDQDGYFHIATDKHTRTQYHNKDGRVVFVPDE